MTLLALLLALPAPGSAPLPSVSPAPQAEDEAAEDDDWVLVNGVAQVVNGDIFTWSELREEVDDARTRVEISTDDEAEQLLEQVRQMMIRNLIHRQAGARMGIPEDRLNAAIDDMIARQDKERQQSLEQSTAWLDPSSRVLRDHERREVMGELQRQIWVQHVIGQGQGAVGRPTFDAYMRPGKLFGVYTENPQLFVEGERVELQFLVILGAAFGSLEFALEQTKDLREDLTVGGADFDELVAEFGAFSPETGGRRPPIETRRIPEAQLREFALAAEVGGISEPLPFRQQGQLVGWQLVRLTERVEGGTPPPFTDPDIQGKLREFTSRVIVQNNLTRSDAVLKRNSYFWPPLQRPGARPQP
jgi:hypothetical protein